MYRTKIHVKGTINSSWSDWFQELRFQSGRDNKTILYGDLPDMSAVYEVISRLGSLVVKLVSVTCKEVVQEDKQLVSGVTS